MAENNGKNQLDLIIALDITLAIMDSYNLKHKAKKLGTLFRNEIEKHTNAEIDQIYKVDEEFITNALNLKERMFKDIASLNEAEQLMLSEFVHKFVKNKEIAMKKGILFFDKIL
jgi:hypothetical protein